MAAWPSPEDDRKIRGEVRLEALLAFAVGVFLMALAQLVCGAEVMPADAPTAGVTAMPAQPVLGEWAGGLQRASDLAANYTSLQKAADGDPKIGNTTYSTWSCASRDGKMWIVWGNSPAIADLYELTPTGGVAYRNRLYHAGGNLGEATGPRWDFSGTADSTIYYCVGTRLCSQDVLVGKASEKTIHDFGRKILAWQYGGPDNAARLFAIGFPATETSTLCASVGLYDRDADAIVVEFPVPTAPATKDWMISPCGRWVKAGKIYSVSDLRAGIVAGKKGSLAGGHGGWAWARGADHCGWAWIETSTGWLQFYDPADGSIRYLQHESKFSVPNPAGGYIGPSVVHVASSHNPASAGWALVSTASDTDRALGSDCWLIELESMKAPGVAHPAYGGDAEVFSAATVPEDRRPRMVWLGRHFGRYVPGAFFSESAAGIGWDGTAYVASNWDGTDNQEVYRIPLPTGWAGLPLPRTATSGPVTTDPPATPTPTPEPPVVDDTATTAPALSLGGRWRIKGNIDLTVEAF